MSARRSAMTAVASLAIGALSVLVPASPAAADPALHVDVDTPSVDGAHATISGTAGMDGSLDRVRGITIRAASANAGDSCNGCGATFNQGRVTSFSWTTADFQYNGPYDVTVVATGQKLLDNVTNTSVTTEAHTTFKIEIDPGPPAGVKAELNPDSSVTVSWQRNPEPDLAGYQVRRAGPGSAGVQTVAPSVDQPADGSRVQWTDSSARQTGGQFEYQVVAVRPDGDGALSDRATAASTGAGVSVPVPPGAPPPPPGTPGAPGAPGSSGTVVGPDGIVTTGPGGAFTSGSPGLDLSSFVTSGGLPPGIAVPGGVVLPDGTFSPTLPFGSKDIDEPGDDSVEILGHPTSRRALLLPVATGLLMCVVALHLRRFNRRVLVPSVKP